jgi:hypothetical protein
MINLIPPKAKKTATKEYWVRILSAWAFLLTAVAVIAALLLLPTYVLIKAQLSALDHDALQQNGSEQDFKTAEAAVRQANATAKELALSEVAISSHEVMQAISDAATHAITLNAFHISRMDKTINSVQIQGVAASREALAQFKTDLERSPLFDTATVPISDLAQDANLPFAITVTMASRTKK